MSRALRWTAAWIGLVQDLILQTRGVGTICCIQTRCFYPIMKPIGLQSLALAVLVHTGIQEPCPALKWNSGVKEKLTDLFTLFFLMFVLLFLFSLILRASSLIYWRLTNQWLFHSERLLFITLNVTKIWLILQQSVLALLQKSHNFSVERDGYPDNYSQVYSGDRSESNTFSSVKISPE